MVFHVILDDIFPLVVLGILITVLKEIRVVATCEAVVLNSS